MNIQIQIEQLILEEMDLSPGQRSQVQVAVEAELYHLVAGGLPSGLQGGGFISSLPVTVNPVASTNPEMLGVSIARSIYAQLRK
ncbi:MAG: hypothetical protein KME18_23170 [Phormidium tanganyikae FI6-MK23]|jgi:hypothetical protein|nr:hypothetical protein [Phormidium tanganyikae FI6-MK23]